MRTPSSTVSSSKDDEPDDRPARAGPAHAGSVPSAGAGSLWAERLNGGASGGRRDASLAPGHPRCPVGRPRTRCAWPSRASRCSPPRRSPAPNWLRRSRASPPCPGSSVGDRRRVRARSDHRRAWLAVRPRQDVASPGDASGASSARSARPRVPQQLKHGRARRRCLCPWLARSSPPHRPRAAPRPKRPRPRSSTRSPRVPNPPSSCAHHGPPHPARAAAPVPRRALASDPRLPRHGAWRSSRLRALRTRSTCPSPPVSPRQRRPSRSSCRTRSKPRHPHHPGRTPSWNPPGCRDRSAQDHSAPPLAPSSISSPPPQAVTHRQW